MLLITGAAALVPPPESDGASPPRRDDGALPPRRDDGASPPPRDHESALAPRLDPAALRSDHPAATLRKMTRLGRLALHVTEAALAESGLPVELRGDRLGLVFGTALADLDETAAFLEGVATRGEALASPQSFQRSIHGAVAGELAIALGLTGYNLTVSEGLASGEAALFQAVLAIRSGRCERCLCVAADGRAASLRAALHALGIAALPGEGVAAVVLEPMPLRPGARALAALASVDLRGAVRSPNPGAAEPHGAEGLVQTVLALRAPAFAGAPPTVRLAPAEQGAG